MNDLISRQKIIDSIMGQPPEPHYPSWYSDMIRELSPEEPKTGKWIEKEVIHADEAKEAIEEWQSCKCSVCGRYDTRPYLYYFSEPNYCSWCGAKMKEVDDE